MTEIEIVKEFLEQVVHLRHIGAVATLCGVPATWMIAKKFFFITQVGGKHGCEDCRREYRDKI